MFWKDFRKTAKDSNQNVLLFSEIFGDTSQWLQGDMFDGTMNYSFRESMVDYFATKRMSISEFSDSLANLYFMYSFKALSSCQNLLSSHDVKRFLNRCSFRCFINLWTNIYASYLSWYCGNLLW